MNASKCITYYRVSISYHSAARKLTEHIHLLTALFTAALYNDIRFEAKCIYTPDSRGI